MPPEALGLALAAAVLHASWNVLLRGSKDVEARTAVVLGLSVLLYAPVAVATWSASWAVVPYIAGSAALEGAYFVLLVSAYRRRELSVVYPVARGSAPVLVLIGSAVALGRGVSAGEAGGVCLVAGGVVLVRGLRRGAEGIAVGLAIGCAIASYTLV
ncbi:MAG: EamA family transporter, partial [Gaiellaceae bacterium]